MISRKDMVRKIRKDYGLLSPKVLAVMSDILRKEFVSDNYKNIAYEDRPIPIGFGQTISQPYTVAFMTNLLVEKCKSFHKVLEIGTGSGYQAAILSKFFEKVYTVEIVPELAKKAREIFKRLKIVNIKIKIGSGEIGWNKYALYDAIIITADIREEIPKNLVSQLKEGGVLVAPVRGRMKRFKKHKNGIVHEEDFGEFSFVPFVATS